jgi:DnaJ-domain-containing protein 1
MTERLQHVIAQLEQLPEEDQDRIAAIIQEELDERAWDALVSTPESQRFLAQLADEVRKEEAAGQTEEVTDSW